MIRCFLLPGPYCTVVLRSPTYRSLFPVCGVIHLRGRRSGIPYSDVNLKTGHAFNPGFSPGSTLAEATTLQLEFRWLCRRVYELVVGAGYRIESFGMSKYRRFDMMSQISTVVYIEISTFRYDISNIEISIYYRLDFSVLDIASNSIHHPSLLVVQLVRRYLCDNLPGNLPWGFRPAVRWRKQPRFSWSLGDMQACFRACVTSC